MTGRQLDCALDHLFDRLDGSPEGGCLSAGPDSDFGPTRRGAHTQALMDSSPASTVEELKLREQQLNVELTRVRHRELEGQLDHQRQFCGVLGGRVTDYEATGSPVGAGALSQRPRNHMRRKSSDLANKSIACLNHPGRETTRCRTPETSPDVCVRPADRGRANLFGIIRL